MSLPFPLVKQYYLFIRLSQSPYYGCGWLNDWQVLVNLVLGHQCRKQADDTWRATCYGLVWDVCSVFRMRDLLWQEPSYSDPNGDSEIPRRLVSADICLKRNLVWISLCVLISAKGRVSTGLVMSPHVMCFGRGIQTLLDLAGKPE